VGDSGSELRLRSDIAHNRPVGSRFFDDSNPSPPRRDYPPLSFFNIETTVMVSINNQSAIAAAIDSHRQRHPALMTTSRASRRCPVGIHHLDLSASLFRFVNDDGNELRPTGVMNTFRQMMVLDHPFDIQIFEFDDTIFLGKFVCLFEMMISTLPSHVLMPLGQQANGFLSSPAPSFAARNSSLRCLQFALCLTMILRIRNLIVIRQMGKSLEAHINPNPDIRSKNNNFLFNLLDREYYVPTIGFAFDRTSFDDPVDRSRQKDFDATDLRQMQFFRLLIELKSALFVGERVVSRTRTKARKTRDLTFSDAAKEMLKGQINAPQGFLDDLRMNSCEARVFLFDLWQLLFLIAFRNGDAGHPISVSTLLKRGVIKFAKRTQPRFEDCDNLSGWLQFVLVGFHGANYT
jgi:hypothetical protein